MRRLWLLLCIGGALAAPLSLAADPPKVGVADFRSSTLDAGKVALLNDALKAELSKTGIIVLQDSAWNPGTSSGLDQGVAGAVESFGKAWVLSIKVVDLKPGVVTYSDTLTVNDETQLLPAIRQLVSQWAVRARERQAASKAATPSEAAQLKEAQWKSVGAEGAVLAALTARGEGTENYLSLRQYDSTITPPVYLQLYNDNIDIEALRSFLQYGLSYRDARRALSQGITRLDKYDTSFKPAGLDFSQYLDAYEAGLSTPSEYKAYAVAAQRDSLALGLGGAADRLPLGDTQFKVAIAQIAWEHSWRKSPHDWYRYNTEAGLFLLGLFIPTPYFGADIMMGSDPFFVKAGIGGHAEMLIGGHAAISLRLGLEVAGQYEVTFFAVPWGSEPKINYTGGFSRWQGPSDGPIHFPYYAMLFTYKLPLVGLGR